MKEKCLDDAISICDSMVSKTLYGTKKSILTVVIHKYLALSIDCKIFSIQNFNILVKLVCSIPLFCYFTFLFDFLHSLILWKTLQLQVQIIALFVLIISSFHKLYCLLRSIRKVVTIS